MSMISSLIDELNKSADEWNGSNMFELARMCREAADTITELRGALQVASVDYRHLQDENAKLRELVVALYHIHFGSEEESWDAWEDFCPCDVCEERHGGEAPCAHTAKDMADDCCDPITKEIVTNRMRDLGIEVDE